MAWVSVTRLRLRSAWFLPGFFFHAFRSQRQVQRADGYIAGKVLPDHDRAFWTLTAWESRPKMLAYMTSGAHKQAMPRLLDWCDEASVTGWEQPESQLPEWEEADRKMRTEGRPSKVRHPSEAQLRSKPAAVDYRPPRTSGSVPVTNVKR
jgi:hypothetical protein